MEGESYSVNVGGRLIDLSEAVVMQIVNITPDSFFTSIDPSDESEREIISLVDGALTNGAQIVDVGACSTRPDSVPASADEEWTRLQRALRCLRGRFPDCPLSVDTFRPEIAERAIEEFGSLMVNDVSGGSDEMYAVVARHHVPYVLTFNEPRRTDCTVTRQALLFFAERLNRLHAMGVNDVVCDPGFGFCKTLEENYELLAHLSDFWPLHHPLLVGVSHKSMIYRPLGIEASEALNGTTALHAVALQQGARILRVHETREAQECIRLLSLTRNSDYKKTYK